MTVNSGLRFPKSVIRFNSETGLHPTQKPSKLMSYLIRTYTEIEDVVLDCFCGSGSTAVAARKLDRRYICCDVDQQWVDVALQRLRDTDPYQDRKVGDATQLSLFAHAATA